MDRHMAACFLLLLALAQLAGPAAACVYLYGARHEVVRGMKWRLRCC